MRLRRSSKGMAAAGWRSKNIPVLLEDAGKGYCHALIPEPRQRSFQSLHPPSALYGVEAKAQAVGLGVWGKGVPRLGVLNTPVFFFIFYLERLTARRSLEGSLPLFQSITLHYARALLQSSALHGAKPRVQEMLGLGVWGKGVPRLGTFNTPVFFNFLFGAPNGASFADRHRPVNGTMKLPLEGSSSPIHRRIANSRLPPI